MSTLSENFEKKPINGVLFYLLATLFWLFVLFNITKESYDMWVDGDEAVGVIHDSSIPCSAPKIEIFGALYIINNCKNFPEGVQIPVIAMPALDGQVWVGSKGSSISLFIWERGKWLYIFLGVIILAFISFSVMYARRYLATKT